MAGAADHQGLAPSPCHFRRPRWLRPSRPVEVGEPAHVMHRDAVGTLADLAPVRQKPGDQLLVADDAGHQDTIGDDGVLLPSQWNTTEPCVTSGFLPLRSIVASKHLRGPCGVVMVAACLRAIFDTVERCLLARVFSSEVSMTQCSR